MTEDMNKGIQATLYLTLLGVCLSAFAEAPFSWELGEPFEITNPDVQGKKGMFYDAYTPVFPDPENGDQLIWFYAGRRNYRAVIKSTTFDDINSKKVIWQPSGEVYPFEPGGKGKPVGAENKGDNKGGWVNGIFPQGGGELLGIYHAEDNYFENEPVAKNNVAWMSVMVMKSHDAGMSWDVKNRAQIITAHKPKPKEPSFGGASAHGSYYDEKSRYCYVYFRDNGAFSMARSKTPEQVDSWKKYYKGGFNEPGLGGNVSRVPGFETGSWKDPAIVFSEHLGKYLMFVVKSGDGVDVHVSTSGDLVHWSEPKPLLDAPRDAWIRYPTIIAFTKSRGTTNLRMEKEAWLTYKLGVKKDGKAQKARMCTKFSIR
jgi:hypothetical protein